MGGVSIANNPLRNSRVHTLYNFIMSINNNLQILNAARKNKVYIHLTSPSETINSAYDFLKVKQPLIHLGKQLWEEGLGFHTTNIFKSYFLQEFDNFVFHGVPQINFISYMDKLEGKNITWFVDDLMTDIPKWNPASEAMTPSRHEVYTRWLDRADTILATTEPLAKAIGRPEKTLVLPNLIDMNKFPPYTPRKQFKRVGWVGGNTHYADLRILEPMVTKRTDKEFIFFGALPEGITEYHRKPGASNLDMMPNAKHIGYVDIVDDYDFYHVYLRNLNLDVGLCPLIDCPFNGSKSALKWQEYSALGIPTIASNVIPYSSVIKNRVTGLLVNDREWNVALDLISNEMGEAAYNDVLANWSWQSWRKDLWLKAFRRMGGVK